MTLEVGSIVGKARKAARRSPARRRAARVPQAPVADGGPGLRVTVLLGGPSAEREVSLVSGRAIAAALRRLGHHVTESDISPADVSALDRADIDAVFIALHGAFGESGEVQDLCEARGLAYTGSGPAASRLAMDKVAAKEVFRREGIPTPPWAVLEKDAPAAETADKLAGLGLPVVLKPIDGGSSVDVVIARDEARRDQAARELLAKYGRLLAERFVAGREMTVGVLGDASLPALEIIPSPEHEFYDYTAKYADDAGTQYRFDHGLPADVTARMESAARKAFGALGCRDMGRVDFILDAGGQAWILEINTIPGFTSHSLLPMSAGRVGLTFDALVGRILEMAVARSPKAARGRQTHGG